MKVNTDTVKPTDTTEKFPFKEDKMLRIVKTQHEYTGLSHDTSRDEFGGIRTEEKAFVMFRAMAPSGIYSAVYLTPEDVTVDEEENFLRRIWRDFDEKIEPYNPNLIWGKKND